MFVMVYITCASCNCCFICQF